MYVVGTKGTMKVGSVRQKADLETFFSVRTLNMTVPSSRRRELNVQRVFITEREHIPHRNKRVHGLTNFVFMCLYVLMSVWCHLHCSMLYTSNYVFYQFYIHIFFSKKQDLLGLSILSWFHFFPGINEASRDQRTKGKHERAKRK